MRNATKGKALQVTGIVLDVAPPLAATLTQFPMWINRSSEATISATFLILAMLSTLPFLRQIKAWLKSPSVWVMWCVILVLFIMLRNIINEMVIVCFVGAVSNVAGAAVYKCGTNVGQKPDT